MANLKLLSLYLSFCIISTLPGSSSGPPSCVPSGGFNCGNQPCSPKLVSGPSPCSPPTRAKLTNKYFSGGGDGRRKSECDEQYHDKSELVVGLSSRLFDNGSRCGKMIRIAASNGMNVMAKVVDKCDSMRGCDEKHNIVVGSDGVWNALGLDMSLRKVDVTWSMV
ncbi:ripening-related protein grip22-like [Cornus florida]|uniref:ripening-related protein grip22-like n=1 Tax=Cornus florida TaxID=4283 RepID=UPI00289C7FE4|nr:ripening-related protein grip22-like [Cornus florida]